jgi:hypothetical protein
LEKSESGSSTSISAKAENNLTRRKGSEELGVAYPTTSKALIGLLFLILFNRVRVSDSVLFVIKFETGYFLEITKNVLFENKSRNEAAPICGAYTIPVHPPIN